MRSAFDSQYEQRRGLRSLCVCSAAGQAFQRATGRRSVVGAQKKLTDGVDKFLVVNLRGIGVRGT
jgi:hypothetical protein